MAGPTWSDGTPDTATAAAAAAMAGYSNLCDGSPTAQQTIFAFQTAFNANVAAAGNMESVGALTLDSKLGPMTAHACNVALDGTGTVSACVFCSDGSVHSPGYQCPVPSTGGPPYPDPGTCTQGSSWNSTTAQCDPAPGLATTSSKKWIYWLVGLLVLGAIAALGTVLYRRSKSPGPRSASEPRRSIGKKRAPKKTTKRKS